MRNLRTRLILSHILPLLVIVPLMGIALIYVVETQVMLTTLSNELTQQAKLTAEIARDQPNIWANADQARVFVTRYSAHHQSNVMLVDPKGNLLASNEPSDNDQVGHPLDLPNLSTALAGEDSVQVNHGQNSQTEIIEILVPVINPDQELVGVVRLTHQVSSVYDRFVRLRYIIVGVLAVELLLGVAVGLLLALNLERSLRQVTEAVYDIASGRNWTTLPEQGPQEIRLLLRAFNTLTERLRMLEDARRRLLANLVHEVGRPIGALQSAIQALRNGADQDNSLRSELLEGMEAEVQRLHPLLDNLAQLHDRVLGTLELNCQPVDLSDWLTCVAVPWREAAQAKGIHWEASISDVLPTLNVDTDRLAQVVGNLLSNAVKYTPSGGIVSLTAGVESDQTWIRVSDTGLGMSAEEQQQIFNPFYRSHRGHRFPQGMGLGLTIAHDLVLAHNGRLEVDSELDKGSSFTIWLPHLTEDQPSSELFQRNGNKNQ